MPEIEPQDYNLEGSTIAFSETYEEPNGAALLAYWCDLKGDRERPTWPEFDIVEIMGIAPLVIIKDVINNGEEFRNRYWGTFHAELDRFDGTGKLMADFYKPEDLELVLSVYRRPLLNSTPMIMRGTLHYQEVGAWRTYSSICVGFTDNEGIVTQLVSAYDMGDEYK